MPAIQGHLWSFPIDIVWSPGDRLNRGNLPINSIEHLRFNYASHPRLPYRSPNQTFDFIYASFRKRSRQRKNPTRYTLLDFLREFRVWANYIDIDNLLSLWGSGYRGFLDQNLSTVVFFIGAISEIGYISVRGQSKYLSVLQAFYDQFICNNDELEDQFASTPIFQRMIIYSKIGLIDDTLKLRTNVDPNIVSI